MIASRTRLAAGMTALPMAAIGIWFYCFAGPPRMGWDDDVFRTVDALFTAVRVRDERLVDECEQRLLAYRQQERLSPAAADYLKDVIERARGGHWRPAAEKLYDFMKHQRPHRQIAPS